MRFLSILIFISFLLTSIWFHGGNIIGGGDATLAFYSPAITLNLNKTTWVEYGTGGSTIGYLPSVSILYLYSILEKIGVPTFILQASLFFVVMSVGGISIYYLCTLLLNKKNLRNELISFIAAIFYLFNPFTMSQIWARGQTAQQAAFALLPLALLLFALGIKRKSFLFAVFIASASVIFSIAFGYLTFIIVFWLVLFIYFLFNSSVFSLKLFLLTFFLWLAVNSWWFMPLFSSSGSIYSAGISGSEENLGTLMGVSRNFTPDLLVRLLHRTYFFDPSALSPIYSSAIFQLVSWIPLIFLLVGLYKIFKNRLPNLKFFIIIFTLGLFISLGANPPFGWLFVEIFKKVTVFQAFRNPFEKFGLVYALGYSAVFAYGLVSFFETKKIKWFGLGLVLFLTCVVFAWPMWTGRVVAGPDKKIGLSVPAYYKDLKVWLKENSEDYRVFMTPLWSGDGAFYQWGDGGRYQGSDPMIWLFDQPSVSNTIAAPFYYEFTNGMRKYMERMNLAPALALLRAKFLVDREDAIMLTNREKKHISFLTESIYPPQEEDLNGQKICQDKDVSSSANGTAWIVCPISEINKDLSKVRYLIINIKTDVPALLDISVRDRKKTTVRWDGRTAEEYRTLNGNFTKIVLPLSAPTEYNNSIDFADVEQIDILARQADLDEFSVREITLKSIIADSGREEKINAFNQVKVFGNLKVFKPHKFTSPPEFGLLNSLEQVKDILQLFDATNNYSDRLDKKGFVVTSQNPDKNLSSLIGASDMHVFDKRKISSTRYWLNLAGGSKGWVLLSKTFSPEWKLIPAASFNKLSGNLFDDLGLLRKPGIDEEKHFVVNGYANLWVVDGIEQQYAIIYKPQIVADIGAKISKYTVYILLVIILFYSFKKYVKKIH